MAGNYGWQIRIRQTCTGGRNRQVAEIDRWLCPLAAKDVSDDDVSDAEWQVLDEAGFDGDGLLDTAATPAVKEELRKFTTEVGMGDGGWGMGFE